MRKQKNLSQLKKQEKNVNKKQLIKQAIYQIKNSACLEAIRFPIPYNIDPSYWNYPDIEYNLLTDIFPSKLYK